MSMKAWAKHVPSRLGEVGRELLRLFLREAEEELMAGVPKRECVRK
jgi:hypothetical protein